MPFDSVPLLGRAIELKPVPVLVVCLRSLP